MITIYRLLFIILINSVCFGQTNDTNIRQGVLKNNHPNEVFIFGKWNKNGATETHLKYLGLIRTKKDSYKIMISIWYWGYSKRATSRILIYDYNNKYLGNYYVGMTYDLPEKIEHNKVIFLHTRSTDCNSRVELSFDNGIPSDFFLECKNGFGDIYSFEKDN